MGHDFLQPRRLKWLSSKPTLFKQAVELGAAATTALTDKVTHLVAGDHGGAKYMVVLFPQACL